MGRRLCKVDGCSCSACKTKRKMDHKCSRVKGECVLCDSKNTVVVLPPQEDYLELFQGIKLPKKCTCTKLKMGESCVYQNR